ncbi:hypothetical protein PybrP1_007857 [[Pythium] brassicae (nom. inval.)]|nr:hypothetical protein PybrP1_007857 [[Pythium] brassicae (nom. inval.)]
MLERDLLDVALEHAVGGHLELPDADRAVLARRGDEVVGAPHVGRPAHVVDRVRVAHELCHDLPAPIRVVVAPDLDYVAVAAHDDHRHVEARLVPREARDAVLVGQELLL